MELKDRFILVKEDLKSTHRFFIVDIFQDYFKDPFCTYIVEFSFALKSASRNSTVVHSDGDK